MTRLVSHFRANSFDRNSVLDNRFGAVATTRCTLAGNEQGLREEARRGKGQARGEGREINFVVPRMFAARAAYATWLTSFHELKVNAWRCGLRYRADYYFVRARTQKERAEETDLREEGDARKEGGQGPESIEEILIYTIGVLTSLKNGRLIAQSRIIRRFRVTKPRRGGLYQLDVRANVREEVKKRARGWISYPRRGRARGGGLRWWCAWEP